MYGHVLALLEKCRCGAVALLRDDNTNEPLCSVHAQHIINGLGGHS